MGEAPTDSANAVGVAASVEVAIEAEVEVEIVVNGDATKLSGSSSVADLLVSLDMSDRRVAVAVNRNIVVRSSYRDVQLASGDRIEILEAVGGG